MAKKLGLKKVSGATTRPPSSKQTKWLISHGDMIKLLKTLEESNS